MLRYHMKINYKLSNVIFEKGSVILAGAGPGSLEQVTLKVYVAISKADVIIYDSLVNENILEMNGWCIMQKKIKKY